MPVAVATGWAISGGGFSFISSPRLFVFPPLVRSRSFSLICSRFGGTTLHTVAAVEDDELRWADDGVCTTLVTVMVCLEEVPIEGFVTTMVPSDGSWFNWFKTNVVVEGWGFCFFLGGDKCGQFSNTVGIEPVSEARGYQIKGCKLLFTSKIKDLLWLWL